jgi:hypothetical protein
MKRDLTKNDTGPGMFVAIDEDGMNDDFMGRIR